MLSLRVNKILEEKGVTPYWLGKQTGISQNNIGRTYNIFTIISNWQTQTYVIYLFLQNEKAYRFIGVGAPQR